MILLLPGIKDEHRCYFREFYLGKKTGVDGFMSS